MSAIKMKPVDVVTIGFGWTAAIIAAELTKAGVSVLSLERGEFRDTDPDFAVPSVHDELAYSQRLKLFQDASRDTYSLRNDRSQTALPVRQFGSFLPGDGVGGAGVHWNGVTWRFLPWDFETRSRSIARYGASILGDDCYSQDWGITYDELEAYYDRFEKVAAVGGKAGNLRGQKIAGGNVFEGRRSNEYPNPAMKTQYSGSLFRDAAHGFGYHPFPQPSANSTAPYKNYYGITTGVCVYCGYCERFGCEMYAKASPQVTILPFLRKSPHFELRTNARVLRVELDSTGKKATGVTYMDSQGREVFQPAASVFVTSFVLNNIRMLLLSKIGKPYDPASGTGTVGRNYAYQANTGATAFFRDGKIFNNFMGSGAVGIVIDDFNGDNFDHSKLGFIGGADISQSTTGWRPIANHPVPAGTPRWGAQWKKAAAHYFNRSFSMNAQGGVQAYRGNYCDLDPTYRDPYGQPLMRITFDWGHHEHKQSAFMAGIHAKIIKALNATDSSIAPLPPHYNVVPYQSTHNTGGTIMGPHRDTSVVNKYGQSWDVPNVFVTGAGLFPQNAGYNPTGTVGALTFHTAEAFVNRYMKHQGPLA
jgi:gluconate 2-dehydrogenase alpha chain